VSYSTVTNDINPVLANQRRRSIDIPRFEVPNISQQQLHTDTLPVSISICIKDGDLQRYPFLCIIQITKLIIPIK
jgi:hypothetical protein